MSIACLVMTDGRADCLERTLDSIEAQIQGNSTIRVIHNDSPDVDFRLWLETNYGGFFTIVHTDKRAGFGGAIRNAWNYLRTQEFDYLFATEDDFLFQRPIALDYVTALLDERPDVVQVVFRRQAWNAEEQAAGGVVECHPHAYQDNVSNLGCPYLTHRLFYSTNPYVARRTLLDREWPKGNHSEGFFTYGLLQDPATQFAYWGARADGPWVEHIGKERVGVGY